MYPHMKLCYWNLCIDGCIDVFSRATIYLQIDNNNCTQTVWRCFQNSTSEWGHPFRVRSDHGGENVSVGEYLTWYRGQNRGSLLDTVPETKVLKDYGEVCFQVSIAHYSLLRKTPERSERHIVYFSLKGPVFPYTKLNIELKIITI